MKVSVLGPRVGWTSAGKEGTSSDFICIYEKIVGGWWLLGSWKVLEIFVTKRV